MKVFTFSLEAMDNHSHRVVAYSVKAENIISAQMLAMVAIVNSNQVTHIMRKHYVLGQARLVAVKDL